MRNPQQLGQPIAAAKRPWDARLARRLVIPLKNSCITPNHLTTLRLGVGLAAAAAFTSGTYGWSNLAALLVILSNFLDHTDGELARISGKSSRIGHLYDVASDAAVTILIFVAIGAGLSASQEVHGPSPAVLGAISGSAIALIFYLRMRIEAALGKAFTRQTFFAGFETEDVLYVLPLITLCNATAQFLLIAAICAPLFAIWTTVDYRRTLRTLRNSPDDLEATADAALVTPGSAASEQYLNSRLADLDLERLRGEFAAQGAFVQGETRVSLTFEYLTDTRMRPWWRLISNLKDAFAYFGFRQVFRRTFARRGK